MKTLFFVAALALVAAVYADDEELFDYVPPEFPCVWTVEVEDTTLFSYSRTKYMINSNYARISNYNYDKVLLYDEIFRPDITYYDNETNMTFITVFEYSAQKGCDYDNEDIELNWYLKNTTLFVFDELSFFYEGEKYINKTSMTYNGIDCDVYFDYDVDSYAMFVDKSNQRVVGIISKNDIPDQREEMKFTYGVSAPYTDFTFKEKYVYNCTNNEAIFNVPTRENATCAASATQAVLALVLASLVSAFVALF